MRTISSIVYSLLALVAISTTVPGFAQQRELGGVGLTVYTDVDFRGAVATFRQDEPDLSRTGLNDMISSMRVGPGERWEVCEDAFYRGRCLAVSGEERDLRSISWNDTISSARRVGGDYLPPDAGGAPPYVPPYGPGAGAQRGWYIVLFDQPNYRGRASNVKGALPNFGRRVQSVTIGRGVWELCERPNYRGRCIVLRNSVPDLRVHDLRGRVASLRPVPRTRPIPPPAGDTSLILFDRPDYRGTATTFRGAVGYLSASDSRAQSAAIEGGEWELCEGSNFGGRCVTLERSAPDLEEYGLRDRVGSVRPLRRDPLR
jgi:hypothetical protein